jgi:Fe-S oxidoreductase
MTDRTRLSDLSRRSHEPLLRIEREDLTPLPLARSDAAGLQACATTAGPAFTPRGAMADYPLDDARALNLPTPASPDEERELVARFLSGLEKLFSRENNWTFLQPLLLTVEHCARCQTCSDSCHIFEASGRAEIYRPTYRAEILRRLYFQHVKGGGLLSAWQHGTVELNWPMVARLAELAYRCNLCRRCAQSCPLGADNGLVAHEIRKLFSQEMGIAPKELHASGSMLQLRAGSSTGMTPAAVRDNMQFIDEEMSEKTGLSVETPWDVEGADILLIHNAGEILAWPENPGAFGVLLNAAGVSWTMSSDLVGYDSVNYGVWYDDAQFARVAVQHAEAARRLKVKKIVVGECGHAHKSLLVVADRLLAGDLAIPRESFLTVLRDIVLDGRVALDPGRNSFPVTLHDPCNYVRLMGIVEPQREILRRVCPEFREMHPHGVDNYCCGGGSGFAIMSGGGFEEWRAEVSGRKKLQQILGAFADCADPSVPKYVCAPCSNCKGQIRDLLAYHHIWETHRIQYGGLVELVVNAMTAVRPGFIEWEWR